MLTANSKRIITAISLMAVFYFSGLLGGCATSRQAESIKLTLDAVEAQNRQTQAMVARLDSALAAEMEANKMLRNEMNVTVSDLQRQISMLLENNNDLMQRIEQLIDQVQRKKTLLPSPGIQRQDSARVEAPPSIDCDKTYDDSFILVRRGEYEQAIAGFESFLAECKNHDLVENAYYWTGESYYAMEKYEEAIQQFDYLITNFTSSVNTSRALYKLGRSHQELGHKEDASKTYRRIIDEFSGTLEAEQAKERLKDLQ